MATRPQTPPQRHQLEIEFQEDLLSDLEECRGLNYYPKVFVRMIQEQGAMATTIALIMTPHPSEGFCTLVAKHRPDLTLENAVCNPRFAPLFERCPGLVERARERLLSVGYTPQF
jgi:hypothetical protein